MPRPPQLPVIDWPALWTQAVDWQQWLANAEDPERAASIAEDCAQLRQQLTDFSGLQRLHGGKVMVLCIAEDWCGDVIRHVPVMQALADLAPEHVQLRYLSRADRPDVFARYLTNGGEAIPKMVFLSEQWVETGHWGPMPDACRRLIAQGKAAGAVGLARKLVAAAYAEDAQRLQVADELIASCELAATSEQQLAELLAETSAE